MLLMLSPRLPDSGVAAFSRSVRAYSYAPSSIHHRDHKIRPWSSFTVAYLAGNLHSYIGRHTDGSLQVTITTPDGEHEATQGRLPQSASSDAPHTAAELEAWADARFDDWLRSMNFTYQGLCGGVDSVGDYRACVPEDRKSVV